RDLRRFDWARCVAIDYRIGNGLGVFVRIDIGIDGDGQTAPEAGHSGGFKVDAAGKGLLNCGFGLLHLAIAEVGCELDGSRLDDVSGFTCHNVREGRSAAGVEIVSGPHEEVEIAFERARLREHIFKDGVARSAEIHTVSQAKDRPMTFASTPRKAGAGTPLVAKIRRMRGE